MRRFTNRPNLSSLESLFETMFFASLKTEEAHELSFDIVYIDPENPDPDPPQRIKKDRWCVTPLQHSITLTIPNLVKLASACDPRTSSLAIYHDSEGRLLVWGLVDQGNRYSDFMNYDADSTAKRPGLFQATTGGVGHLIVYMRWKKIAELKINTLITNVLDVFSAGPIRDLLEPGLLAYLDSVKQAVPTEMYSYRAHWDASLRSYWIESICRLLLRVQRYRHGGTFLLTPDDSGNGLNIKYALTYERLRTALQTKGTLTVQHTYDGDQIYEYMESNEDYVPMDLYLDESIGGSDLEDNRRELDSTIWFISLLTRVDGLVLLDHHLNVKGFGVEITFQDEPASVRIAVSRFANRRSALRVTDYNHYGTRHRSMMRYCYHVPGSVGFVISQDGDVRAMTKVREHLVIWENIKLQNTEFMRVKSSTQKRSRTTGKFI